LGGIGVIVLARFRSTGARPTPCPVPGVPSPATTTTR